MMNEILASALVLIFGVIISIIVLRPNYGWERRFLVFGFIAHIVGALSMVVITVYFFGGGDMMAYRNNGLIYAELLGFDFVEYAPDILRYLFRLPTVQHQFFMSGTSTGAMFALSTFLMFFLNGSLYAACILIAIFSFFSKYMIFRALCMSLPSVHHKNAFLASMLWPSTIFWSCGLLKEPVAFLGLGPAFLGFAYLVQGRWFIGTALLLLGSIPIACVKPYVLFPLVLCGVLWLYSSRALASKGQIKLLKQPFYLIVGVAAFAIALQSLGSIFPEFAIDNLAEETANLQDVGQRVEGGSNYAIAIAPGGSIWAQLAAAPIGLAFALFRPLLFDVRNPVILLGALEMMVIMWFWFRIFVTRPIKRTLRIILSNPLLIFCVAFCIIFGAVVGLSSTNIGTMSRYRAPMLPFYVLALLVLSTPDKVAKRQVSHSYIKTYIKW